MDCRLDSREGVIAIEGDFTVQNAAELWPALLNMVRTHHSEARLDLADVSTIDTAGLQILLMIRRLAHAAGTPFDIINPSEPVRSALELCPCDGDGRPHSP